MTTMVFELLRQLFRKPATNKFPVKYTPKSVTETMKKVEKGEVKINPPVETPPKFRGKPVYNREKCIGCGICIKVCPAHAIDLIPIGKDDKGKEKYKVKFYISRCTFCSQCVDVCPVDCISMSNNFLLANADRFADELIVK
ncbi:MAG: 4Fe-4S binding protein [Candidatus Thermoplasmatota archaeon]|nr:4Fe-4S binding protein [Candidatus Thermoplasmatota archaeon]